MQRSRCSQKGLLEEINHHVASRRLRLPEGTIVDASVIEAPSWTKNRAGTRICARRRRETSGILG